MMYQCRDWKCSAAFDLARDIPTDIEENTAALEAPFAVAATTTTPPQWHASCATTVLSLAELPDNWDSYGGPAIDRRAIECAYRFLAYVAQFVNVPEPTISPTGDGTVGFSWDEAKWSLDLTMDGTGLASYVYLDEEIPQGNREIRTRNWAELIPLLTQW